MGMSLRITERSLTSGTLAGLQTNLSKMNRLQEQLSSGKLISRPSDSPVSTVSAMGLRGETYALQQYTRNAEDGQGWLNVADSALSSANSQVRRARELVLQGMSAGTGSTTSARESLAVEIDNIRDGLLSIANTKYLDRPVFGGTTDGAEAYSSGGIYSGDNGTVLRRLGDNTQVRVDTAGPDTFGADTDPTQLFTVLSDIATHLRTDPTALGTDLNRIDTASNRLIAKAGDVGARYNRIENMHLVNKDRLLTIKTQLSDVEDIDLPATIVELELQRTAYQAALSATAKAIQPSLVDFIR